MSNSFSVLVIDDEMINLQIISDILCDEVDIIMAKSGEQGVRKALEFSPDLILLDVIMPDMDGFETMKKLSQDARTCDIPVIFITALNDIDNEEKGLLLGASDYIQKPIHASIIKARVALHLKLINQHRILERLSTIDPLTSLANRRKYEETIRSEWTLMEELNQTLSLAVIDIDNFKQYNDLYGHAAGDIVLQRVATVLANNFIKNRDLVARYGGEEFVAIMPNTLKEEALYRINKCISEVQDMAIACNKKDKNIVTISAGVASIAPTRDDRFEDLFAAADKALYMAKTSGKNQVKCG
ncbi:Phytochrome-like protein cph2 [Marinomonas spartinae]|uniref:GGDEF domain-containing response regulator n=1 Tax=Marinomonas spartinae TaxID=1792290 RepID=UPI000808F2A3|nr:diguanylate cyclase [Marinomonas spartinae]SBS39963.1 Phytochrome-like protein cph2 [Marinomonas spartinae]